MKVKLLFATLFFLSVIVFSAPISLAQEKMESEIFEATVIKVVEKSEIIESDGNKHPYQKLQILSTSGSLKGKTLQVENGVYNQSGVVTYNVGDKISLSRTVNKDGSAQIFITDFVRRVPLYWLIGLFILVTVLIGGMRGARSLLGMILTFLAIFFFILPQISKGADPIIITSISAVIIIPVTFFLAHDVNKKTLCAIAGTFIALILTGILALIFIESTRLTGFVSEEAGFLNTIKKGTLDIRGLLFAGIVIALLGILEDITISQAAIVSQLKKANKSLSQIELFRRAMDIGRDHIASMANTLILVYAGASLPLLLLFIDNSMSFSSVINSEIIAEEIVRTLVASIGLIIAVPITTLISVFVITTDNTHKKIT